MQRFITTAVTSFMVVMVLSSCMQDHVAESTKNIVELHWYKHDTPFNKPTPSSIPVTAYNASDFQSEIKNFLFGQIYVFDDPLTQTASLESASFGRGQGTYAFVSREDIVGYVSYTVFITTGIYNGSTFNVIGAYSNTKPKEFFSIAGGTGHFALARGIVEETIVNLFGPFNASATLSLHAKIYLD